MQVNLKMINKNELLNKVGKPATESKANPKPFIFFPCYSVLCRFSVFEKVKRKPSNQTRIEKKGGNLTLNAKDKAGSVM